MLRKDIKVPMRSFPKSVLVAVGLLAVFAPAVSAASDTVSPTYTYSYEGKELLSPDAYVYDRSFGGAELKTDPLSNPGDLFADAEGNVYIADTGNNRILCLDPEYRLVREIRTFTNPDTGKPDGFQEPGGVFAADDGTLYVADTLNRRIVQLDLADGRALRVLGRPDSPLLDGYVYTPNALAVDAARRIYVVSSGVNVGVVALEADGSFSGFLGAKKVRLNMAELFWRKFMTKEQKAASIKLVPSSYNNIAIDEIGFLYTTTNAYLDWEIQTYQYFRMKDDTYAPVRRLNAAGDDVLRRNGFFPPSGDVHFEIGHTSQDGVSQIVDVALAGNGAYSLLDQKRGKIFTYDENGNLLYVFGGMGVQEGMTGKPSAITYQKEKILLLDRENGRVIVYRQTPYGRLFREALALTAARQYRAAADKWREVLKFNNNNEIAYAAMGQNYLLAQDYESAAEAFRIVRDVQNYSVAYSELRKETVRKIALPLVLVLAGLVWLLVRLDRKLVAFNRAGVLEASGRTLKGRLAYARYIVLHPFDGFYDMKREGRGSVAAASIWLGICALSFAVKGLFTGFIFRNPDVPQDSVFKNVVTLLLPFLLWCTANWCLTTLLNGEGKFKDIYMATCYSLVPLTVFNFLWAILSNVLTLQEGAVLSILSAAFAGWSLLLVFLSGLVIHNYTFGKNLLMVLLTVVGMGVILFIGLLFANVLQKMLAFVVNLYTEIAFRL